LIGALLGTPLLIFLALGFGHNPNVVESPLLGKPAPGFVLSDFSGNSLSSESLSGKPIVLNFWASWCRPCVVEHPYLVAASRRFEGRVHFVGVVPSEDNEEAVLRFVDRLGSWGPALYDEEGKVSIAYGVFKLPETYIIDSEGVITEKVAGAINPNSLVHSLENLL